MAEVRTTNLPRCGPAWLPSLKGAGSPVQAAVGTFLRHKSKLELSLPRHNPRLKLHNYSDVGRPDGDIIAKLLWSHPIEDRIEGCGKLLLRHEFVIGPTTIGKSTAIWSCASRSPRCEP